MTSPWNAPAPHPEVSPANPAGLTVVYDGACAFCRRCRAWLEAEPTYLPLRFLPAGSVEAQERWRGLPWLGYDLVVVGDSGEVWIGPAAFLTCLWATRRYRGWAGALSGPTLAPLAERFFSLVSHQRRRMNRLLGPDPRCPDGHCRNHPGDRRRPHPAALGAPDAPASPRRYRS